MGDVRGADVIEDELGIQVRVDGERLRLVQLLRPYEARLGAAAKGVKPREYLIRPRRQSTSKNLLSNIVDRGVASELGPQTQRMRATWMVRQ